MNIVRDITSMGGENRLPSDQTEAILRRHLDHDFTVFPMADTPVSQQQIETIAARFGVKYPPELIGHICGRFPGLYVEVKEEIWPRPRAGDVGPFWSFLYALHTYTSAPASTDWMRLDHAVESFQRQTGLAAAPILRIVGDADLYCVDKNGTILQFRHEENSLEAVPLDFWQLFDREVSELRKRKDRKRANASR